MGIVSGIIGEFKELAEKLWNILIGTLVPRLVSLSLGVRLERFHLAPLHVHYTVFNAEMYVHLEINRIIPSKCICRVFIDVTV